MTLAGRPNAGKSTLVNRILGAKVSIVAKTPQTTRNRILGVKHDDDSQIVFVDTPGLHKPKSALGERLNKTALAALDDVDVVCWIVDATAPLGSGDAWVVGRLPASSIAVINKTDIATKPQVVSQLAAVASFDQVDTCFAVSAAIGDGVGELVDELVARLPEGPPYFPDDVVTDVPDAFWVAELVREQLLIGARDELPHSIATQVTEWDWPYIRCEILVERDSQKGIVIGKGGERLKSAGTAVREQLADGSYLDLHVKVAKDWQRRPQLLDRLLQ